MYKFFYMYLQPRITSVLMMQVHVYTCVVTVCKYMYYISIHIHIYIELCSRMFSNKNTKYICSIILGRQPESCQYVYQTCTY